MIVPRLPKRRANRTGRKPSFPACSAQLTRFIPSTSFAALTSVAASPGAKQRIIRSHVPYHPHPIRILDVRIRDYAKLITVPNCRRSATAAQLSVEKTAALRYVSTLKLYICALSGIFFLDFFADFGYHIDHGNYGKDLLVQFFGGCNEQILLRNLASIFIQ